MAKHTMPIALARELNWQALAYSPANGKYWSEDRESRQLCYVFPERHDINENGSFWRSTGSNSDRLVTVFSRSSWIGLNKPVPLNLASASSTRILADVRTVSAETEIASESTDAETDIAAKSSDADAPTNDSADSDPSESSESTREPALQWRYSGELSSGLSSLRRRLRRCMAYYYKRPLNTRDDSPWSMMHAMLSFGVDSTIKVSHPRGRSVNAVSWLCGNNRCRGLRLFRIRNDELYGRIGAGYQGHEGQFLALLAQIHVGKDYPIVVGGRQFTVADLIEVEKSTCKPGTELTFKLIALAHYLPSDAQWTDKKGRAWNIPKLISQERTKRINGATCGGTHRLMGLSYAVHKRLRRGEPLDGEWLKAKEFTEKYQRLAFQWQNRDGSFSTRFFRGPGYQRDLDRRLFTTGHILEWMVFSLPADELTDARVVRAANYLSNTMINDRFHDWEPGPRGHAIRALTLYDERVFGGKPGTRSDQLARIKTPSQERPTGLFRLRIR